MTLEQKRAWIRLVVGVVAYAAYAITLLTRANGRALPDIPYEGTLLWTIGAAIAGSIVAEILLGIVNPRASRAKDVRDRQIGQFGNYVGQSFLIIGALAAMLMALADWDAFWIANVIYLGFFLSAVLGSIAKIGMYHGSFPQW